MREIKFRGKRIDNDKWVYGDLLQGCEVCDICEISDCESIDGSRYDIEKNTIGQFTGLYDKNGKEIYEGDIVKIKYQFDEDIDQIKIGVIEYELNKFVAIDEEAESYDINYCDEREVIGNIYDNPELLEVKE